MTVEQDRSQQRRNGRLAISLFGIVLAMGGLSFAAVPLYDLFCRVTGFGGTTQVADGFSTEILDRTMRVRFTADANRDLPWQFEAERREVEVRVGEPMLVYYTARNLSDEPVAGTAVYNVNPHRTGIYFNKVQCFCFDEQIIMPGEEVTFPVYFFVDAALDADRGMDDVRAITLSYTFFPTQSEALDEAVEHYYQSIEQSDGAPSAQAAPANAVAPIAVAARQ